MMTAGFILDERFGNRNDLSAAYAAFYNTRDIGPWPAPEVPQNINREELGHLRLTEQEIDDLVAFTLTDGSVAGATSR